MSTCSGTSLGADCSTFRANSAAKLAMLLTVTQPRLTLNALQRWSAMHVHWQHSSISDRGFITDMLGRAGLYTDELSGDLTELHFESTLPPSRGQTCPRVVELFKIMTVDAVRCFCQPGLEGA